MEKCSVIYSIPSLTATFNPSANVHASTIIDVWNLETVGEISRHIGDTWKYASPRKEKLGSINMSDPKSGLASFLCRSNQFSTFELACSPSSPGCYLDLWQDQRAEPKAGECSFSVIFIRMTLIQPIRHIRGSGTDGCKNSLIQLNIRNVSS